MSRPEHVPDCLRKAATWDNVRHPGSHPVR
jgi:hypothetical protein